MGFFGARPITSYYARERNLITWSLVTPMTAPFGSLPRDWRSSVMLTIKMVTGVTIPRYMDSPSQRVMSFVKELEATKTLKNCTSLVHMFKNSVSLSYRNKRGLACAGYRHNVRRIKSGKEHYFRTNKFKVENKWKEEAIDLRIERTLLCYKCRLSDSSKR